MTPDLTGETVLVTGASRGLGAALARAYAGAGAAVVLCARGRDALDAVASELEAGGAAVLARAADVSRPDQVASLVQAANERLGPVTALVNNASVLGSRAPLRDQALDEWRTVLEVNLTGCLVPIQATLPAMRERGAGSIINVTSGVGNRPRANWGAYAVSKWAVEALTWNLAEEEREAGVRVNAVDPGSMRTAMRRAAYPQEDPSAPAPPSSVTGVFLWLVSASARDVTGRRFRAAEWAAPERA